MKSVVKRLGTEEFPRIRIGTGFCDNKEKLINYVISRVSNEEYIYMQIGINAAETAITEILKNGIDNAMNKLN